MTGPVARARGWALAREVRALEALRAGFPDARARRDFQLERLNAVWAEARAQVPYWRQLGPSLPPRFRTLEEFAATIPETTRDVVQKAGLGLAHAGRPPDQWRMTGGSTSRPVRLPAWKSEFRETRGDTWLGRSWYGVRPEHRLFLLWGHAHVLGSGIQGRLRAAHRTLWDRLLGYHRFSAYDLRPEAMRRAGAALLRFAPDWVVAYSMALHAFAAANADRREQFHRLRLRVAVATAEAFPDEGSAARVADLLGCPVAMEYGSVETGVLAHTRPEGFFEVLWHRYLVEAVPADRGARVLVTSLSPRCTPLFRYDMGDEVTLPPGAPAMAVDRVQHVLGRCNEYVELPDGTRLHSEVFAHAVRPCPEILGFQVMVGSGDPRLAVLLGAPLSEEARRGVLSRLGRVHAGLARMEIVRVEALRQTLAGKTRMIVRQES